MLPGETQTLLVKPKPSYFPVPPPPPRDGTIYAWWKFLDCTCSSLPIWQQDSSSSIRWAANTYDCCMTPAYLYDRFIYRICCCGNSECCDCATDDAFSVFCNVAAVGSRIPKIPCVLLSGTSALFAGIAGAIGDCVAPPRELMDDPRPLSSVVVDENSFESKNALLSQNSRDAKPNINRLAKKRFTISDLILQIDNWIKKEDLEIAVKFFTDKDDKLDKSKLKLLEHPELYPKKVFLICLAIRCLDEKISLETRRAFILALLDNEIVNGYESTEGWITAPLLEAARSNYCYASHLLETLCEFRVNILNPCGIRRRDELPNYVLIWIYAFLLENHNNDLLYRAILLMSYVVDTPSEIDNFLLDEQNSAYRNLHTEVKEVAVCRAKRHEIYGMVQSKINNKNVALLICQYSGIFSPGSDNFDPMRNVITTPIRLKSEEKDSPEKQVGLNKYNPLPQYRRPEPAVATDNISSGPSPIYWLP